MALPKLYPHSLTRFCRAFLAKGHTLGMTQWDIWHAPSLLLGREKLPAPTSVCKGGFSLEGMRLMPREGRPREDTNGNSKL